MVLAISGLRVPSKTESVQLTSGIARALVRQQEKELSELGARLASLRSSLRELEQLGLSPARVGRAAAATSSSSLDLTTAQADNKISSVSNLSGISTGDLVINGVSIAINVSMDSLNDVISGINAADAGATASLDEDADFLTIRSTSRTSNLILDDDTSGFFTGVNISPGAHRPIAVDGSLKHEAKIGKLILEVGKAIDEIFNPEFEILSPNLLVSIQEELEDAIRDTFGIVLPSTTNKTTLRSSLGIDIDFTNRSRGVFEFDPEQLDRSFRNDATKLNQFLFRDPDGFVVGLIAKLDELETTPLEELDPESGMGFLVELRV